jgi:hypothetical protein
MTATCLSRGRTFKGHSMSCGTAPEAGRTGGRLSLYSFPRSSLQGGIPWVVVMGPTAVTNGGRLRLVEDGVGFEPTGPLCSGEPGGPPERKSGALSRSAARPVPPLIGPLGLRRSFSSANVLSTFLDNALASKT